MSDKLEAGSIVEGKVIRVKPFGAIVAIEGAGQGLVHISQISSGFVKDINDFVKAGDIVKVKILSIDEESGKISLSMKEASPKTASKENSRTRTNKNNFRRDTGSNDTESSGGPSDSFEDKMKEFLKASSEKQAVLNKRINKR